MAVKSKAKAKAKKTVKSKARLKLLGTPEHKLLSVRVPRKRAKRVATPASVARSTKASARQRAANDAIGLTARGTPRKNAGYGTATATLQQPEDRLFETRGRVPPLQDNFYGTSNIGVASLAHMFEDEVQELEGLQKELEGYIANKFIQYHK